MRTAITCSLCMFFCLVSSKVVAQTSPCTSNTPYFNVDLSGQPNGAVTVGPIVRDGLCCGATSPDVCLMIEIKLDSHAVGFRFDITSGAVPPGAMYYQVGCQAPTKVGDIICLEGEGPHILTFCKPGNNNNEYTITSIPVSIVPDSVGVDVGCFVEIGTLGYFIDSTLVWKDLTSSTGEYLDYLDCIKGCDTVIVTPDYNAPAFIDYEVCGNLIDTVCQDTVPYLCRQVRVYINSIEDSVNSSICSNESYTLPDGQSADTSGTYIVSVPSSNGCDSTIFIFLTVYPAYDLQAEITACDSALCNGNWYYSSGIVVDSFTSVNGCDSVITTDITIQYSNITNLALATCDSALINGNWYFTTQTVVDSFQTYQGCDSIVITDLNINYSIVVNQSNTACDSALVNGNWYYSSQTVTDNFSTIAGCDSIVITDLTIHYSIEILEFTTSCDNALINGKWYYSPQTIRDTFATYLGCDSIIVTELITYNSVEVYQEFEVCDVAQVNGNWYYDSQIIHDTFSTFRGCDSVVITNLTVNNSKTTSASLETCDSARVNGNWYYNSQTIIDSFTTYNGCDSVHTSYLSVYYPSFADVETTICEGDRYTLPDGRIIIAPGSYTSVLINNRGCDSIVQTVVNMNYTYYQPEPDTAKCLGDEIMVNAGQGVDIVDYQWSTGENGPSIMTTRIGTLHLKVSAANGCTARDTIKVLDANCPACPVYTPTAFSPNNTSLNDNFKPVSACEFREFRFEIYNRWGECLYKSNDPNEVWDGTYLGAPAKQDVYIWLLYYIDKRALIPISHSGTITLLR